MDAELFPDLRKRKELEKSGQGIVRYRGFENCEKCCRFRIVTNRPCGCSGVRDACSGTVWIPDTKVINDIIDQPDSLPYGWAEDEDILCTDTILKKTGYLIKNRGNFCSGVRIDDCGKIDRKRCRNTVFVSSKQSFSKRSLLWVTVNWFSSKSRENSMVIHCGTHFMHTLSCSNNSVDESLFVGLQGVHPVDKDRPERNFS